MNCREEILEKIHSVPGIPVAASQAMALAQNPDADLNEMARLLEYDPGLTSHVLRLANSPFFSRSRTIGSVHQAVVALGVRKVGQLVLASAVAPMAWQAVKGYDLEPGRLWEHFIGVAVGAVKLAEILEKPVPDYTFTAGLLHDIGKIVLGTFVEVDAAPILRLAADRGFSFEVAERRLLGIDHAEAGARLLEAWNFPAEVVDVVRWHHEPQHVPPDRAAAVDMVHAADLVCLMCGVGLGADGLRYTPSPAVMRRLGLRESTLEALANAILGELENVQGMVGEGEGETQHGA